MPSRRAILLASLAINLAIALATLGKRRRFRASARLYGGM